MKSVLNRTKSASLPPLKTAARETKRNVSAVFISQGAIVIHEVYEDGAAAQDGRLWAGDQILEVSYPMLLIELFTLLFNHKNHQLLVCSSYQLF